MYTRICKDCNIEKLLLDFQTLNKKWFSKRCKLCFKINKEKKEKDRISKLAIRIKIPDEKTCLKCNTLKSSICFYLSKNVLSGLESTCKECRGKTLQKSSKKYKEKNYKRISIHRHEFYEKYKYRIDFRYKEYKHAARRRNIQFELTLEEVNLITSFKCFYCNQFSLNRDHVGIDRIDNNLGYIKNNVIPCCSICNIAKGSLTFDQFKTHILRIINNGITNLSPEIWFRDNMPQLQIEDEST